MTAQKKKTSARTRTRHRRRLNYWGDSVSCSCGWGSRTFSSYNETRTVTEQLNRAWNQHLRNANSDTKRAPLEFIGSVEKVKVTHNVFVGHHHSYHFPNDTRPYSTLPYLWTVLVQNTVSWRVQSTRHSSKEKAILAARMYLQNEAEWGNTIHYARRFDNKAVPTPTLSFPNYLRRLVAEMEEVDDIPTALGLQNQMDEIIALQDAVKVARAEMNQRVMSLETP